jgi:hypothetical protein
MATKSGQKGRYICKVGFYDVYAKDSFKPKKDSKFKYTKPNVASTVYNIYHSKKLVEKGYKTKDEAVAMAKSLLGDKVVNYGLS